MFGSKDRSSRPTMDIDTLIGARTTIEGSVKFSGGLRIDGTVRGSLVSEGDQQSVLMLSDKGVIEGEVRAPHVIVNGTLKGDIVASERVELAAQARVTGNIFYKILEMAAGAEVTGQILRQEEPRKQLARPEVMVDDKVEARLEAKIEPKEKSRLEAKRA